MKKTVTIYVKLRTSQKTKHVSVSYIVLENKMEREYASFVSNLKNVNVKPDKIMSFEEYKKTFIRTVVECDLKKKTINEDDVMKSLLNDKVIEKTVEERLFTEHYKLV